MNARGNPGRSPSPGQSPEARLAALTNQSVAGVAETDPDGHFTFVNDRYCEIVGYSREELLGGLRMQDITYPDDLPANTELFVHLIEDATPFAIEKRYLRKDGATVWVGNSVSPITDEAGQVLAVVAMVVDITERKRAEAALHQSEQRLAALLEQAPVGIGLTDATGRWLLSNSVLRTFVGETIPSRDPGTLPRWQTWDEAGHPVAPSQWPGARGLRGETVAGMDFLFTPESGPSIWTRVTASPFRDADGAVTGVITVIEDVDARKRAEAALRHQLEVTRTIADNATLALFLLDAEQRCTFMNPAAERMTGFAFADLDGMCLHDAIHHTRPDGTAYPLAECPIDRALPEHRQMQGEEVFIHQDGHFYPVAFMASPILRDGRPAGTVLEVQDLTARKRTERLDRFLAEAGEILVSSLDEQETLARIAHLAVPLLADHCVVDLFDGDEVRPAVAVATRDEASAEALRAIRRRFPPNLDAPGSPVAVAVRTGRPQVVDEVSDAVIAQFTGGAPIDDETRRLIARAALVAPMVIRGRTLGTISLGSDQPHAYGPDDLRWAEELARRCALALDNARLYREAREAEARIRRLFDAGVVGMIVADEARILDANDHFLAMVGHTRADLEAGHLRWQEMTPPEYHQHDQEILADLRARDFCAPFEKEFWRKDGTRVPILIGAASVARNPDRWLCFVLDLSTQKQAERDRQSFIDATAHDLKNPLTSLKGQAQLLLRRVRRTQDGNSAAIEAGLESIDAAATRMLALIDDLMDVAYERSGRSIRLSSAPTDLVALVETCVADARRSTTKHRLQVETSVASLVGDWDGARLERVVQNLLANAIKYSPGGGAIGLRITREQSSNGTCWAVLSVRDQGLGIPAVDLPHIFDGFRRGQNVRGIGGTGIGLAGAKRIVEQHGGTITVESVEGSGSTFTLWLPALPTGRGAGGRRPS